MPTSELAWQLWMWELFTVAQEATYHRLGFATVCRSQQSTGDCALVLSFFARCAMSVFCWMSAGRVAGARRHRGEPIPRQYTQQLLSYWQCNADRSPSHACMKLSIYLSSQTVSDLSIHHTRHSRAFCKPFNAAPTP